MNLFKTFKLKWWQVSLLKIAMVSFGIILGVYLKDVLENYLGIFWILFLIPATYITYIWWKQK